MANETERLRRFYDESAGAYDRWMRFYDRVMLDDGRRRVCSRAEGRTLELAIGTGLNLPFYPGDVRLTGVDLSPAMLAVAGQRARELGVDVELRLGDAHALDLPDDSFDTVVSTLFLSTVPDPRRAAAEVGRVLKPSGRLLLLDHVRSPNRLVRWVERLLDPPMRRFAGVHLLRDPLDYLGTIGFRVERYDRSRGGIVLDLIARKNHLSTQLPRWPRALLKGGVNVKVVSERLGRADVALTLNVYSHVLFGMQAEAARKIDELLT